MIFFFFNAESPEKGPIRFADVKRQNAGHDLADGVHKWHSPGASGSDGNCLSPESHESGVTGSQHLAGQLLSSPLPELRGRSLCGPVLYCYSRSRS